MRAHLSVRVHACMREMDRQRGRDNDRNERERVCVQSTHTRVLLCVCVSACANVHTYVCKCVCVCACACGSMSLLHTPKLGDAEDLLSFFQIILTAFHSVFFPPQFTSFTVIICF